MKETLFHRFRLALLLIGLALFSTAIFAQEEEEDEEPATEPSDEVTEEAAEGGVAEGEYIEEVVVTGSRLKRTTFESVSPLQVIDAEVSREAGLIDTGEILQESSQASGQQVDLTYNGFVLDNGPGAVTLDLRGLSSDRTLILINGRRVAPAGVEGAPSSPDLSLVPGTLSQRIDLLLDGASSIYGSDAIAGVANIILRKDFDGLEIDGFASRMEANEKSSESFTMTWGRNFDRGLVGIAYSTQSYPHVSIGESAYLGRECSYVHELDENGMIRQDNLWRREVHGMEFGKCRTTTRTASRFQVGGLGGRFLSSLYSTPGFTNGGWPGFSSAQFARPFIWNDADDDGMNDVNYLDYSHEKILYGTLYQGVERYNFMAYGEYTLDNEMNVTPYFEVIRSNRKTHTRTAEGQLFPWVDALNPFNICNPNAPGGVDCGLARDAFLSQPDVIQGTLNAFGIPSTLFLTGPLGPQNTRPILRIAGDRNNVRTNVGQTRYVIGVSADLPWLSIGSLSGWSADLSATYSHSTGTSLRRGVHDLRLQIGLGHLSLTATPCDVSGIRPSVVGLAPVIGQVASGAIQVEPEDLAGCVPINLFAPSLYPGYAAGHFATERERDYLFVDRTFDTQYRQSLYSLVLSGGVFELPYGTVSAAVGLDMRRDALHSIPNRVASEGQLWGFFADGGATGTKTTEEAFLELELPILANMQFVQDLSLNVSGRLTDDEFYGTESTWAAKIGYRPMNSLLIRATQGTSYRAPNLRNLFLAGQTGFLSLGDPCLIPLDAYDQVNGVYVPENDERTDILLGNCRANGIDPTNPATAWNDGFNSYSVEVRAGGSLTLSPETSNSLSVGFVFEQPFTNAFNLTVGANYYQIDVDDTIIEPSAGYIINDCYNSPTMNSPFCSRISRAPNARGINTIDLLDIGFINRDNEQVRGIDGNVNFATTITLLDRPFELNVDINGHRLLERSTLFTNDAGFDAQNEFVGEWGYHKTKANVRVFVDFGNWRVGWAPRYLGNLNVDANLLEDYDDIDGGSYACGGPSRDDVLCTRIHEAESYMTHSVYVRYAGFAYTIGAGISNVTDQEPPFITDYYYGGLRNHPFGGYGYDLTGRSAYLSVSYRFDQ